VLFRRGASQSSVDEVEAAERAAATGPETAKPAPKGRPTPSRKEAEAARKERVKPQLDKRSAARADRATARANRLKARDAMAGGDPRYLPARDQGPVRAFLRDYVDSRRTLGEFMLPALVIFVPLTLAVNSIPSVTVRGYVVLATYLYMLLVVGGTALTGMRARRAAAAKFPDASLRGASFYAAMRSLQLRRWRLPKPRVKPGQPV
jgi:hypothetical protein